MECGFVGVDTTAIGQINQQSISLSNVGDGDAVINAIDFSSDIFTVDSASSVFTITEGNTQSIVINFAPSNAGEVNETMTFYTNDPTNPTIEIVINAVGISQVSGEICNETWTLVNSPYTLVGDVTIPEGCFLTVEAGVEIMGGEFGIVSHGDLTVGGSEELPCLVQLVSKLSRRDESNNSHTLDIPNEVGELIQAAGILNSGSFNQTNGAITSLPIAMDIAIVLTNGQLESCCDSLHIFWTKWFR